MRLNKLALSISLAVIAMISSCRDGEPPAEKQPGPAKVESSTPAATPTPAPTPFVVVKVDLGEGLTYEVLAAGTGDETVVEGVTARLETRLSDTDGKELWSGDFSFTVGTGQAVPGFDRGVQGMMVGEKRRLYVPASLGYGNEGKYPVKPGQDIVFEVVLKEITRK